jgi:hypothetical protein
MHNAGAPFVHIRNHEPLETRKNQNELLLQEDRLLFLLQYKHLFMPSNFTSAACIFATSEGRPYRSDGGFSRTDIPSSQYRGANCGEKLALAHSYSRLCGSLNREAKNHAQFYNSPLISSCWRAIFDSTKSSLAVSRPLGDSLEYRFRSILMNRLCPFPTDSRCHLVAFDRDWIFQT